LEDLLKVTTLIKALKGFASSVLDVFVNIFTVLCESVLHAPIQPNFIYHRAESNEVSLECDS